MHGGVACERAGALKIKGCIQLNPGHVHRLPSLCDGGNPSVRSGGLKVVKPGDGWDMQAAAVACDALCITADLLDKFAACASGDACKVCLFPSKSARQNTRISKSNYPFASQHSVCVGFGLEASDCSIISRIALLSPTGWLALAGQVRYRAYFCIHFKEVAV
jgi:hypothetical protein